MIGMDHFGPLPRSRKSNTYLLVVVDALTKFVLLHPSRDSKAKPATRFLENSVFLVHGVPEILLSDNAHAFMGHQMAQLLNTYGIQHFTILYHHPQANFTERYVQTVGTAIRCMLFDQGHDHTCWDNDITHIQAALNSLAHNSTGISPFKMNFGREMIWRGDTYSLIQEGQNRAQLSDGDLQDQFQMLLDRAKAGLRRAQEVSRERYDQNTRRVSFVVGGAKIVH